MITERLFYSDPYAAEFTATIVNIVKDTKQYKKEEKCNHSKNSTGIVLNKTLFYPTSGGQLNDVGTLQRTSGDGAVVLINISDVTEESDESIVHWTEDQNVSLKVGDEVKGKIDFDVRMDYLQQHHGQHILSKAFIDIANVNTIGFHMSKQVSNIDLDGLVSDEVIAKAQQLANQVLQSKPVVDVKLYSLEEAKKLPLRKLDEKVVEPVRIVTVSIGDKIFDIQACCGTHPIASNEVGSIVVLYSEKIKKVTRLYFICGNRVVNYATNSAKVLKSIGTKLGIPPTPEEVEKAVEQTLENNTNLKKTIVEYEKIIFKSLAQEVFQTSAIASKSGTVKICCKIVENQDVKNLRMITKEPIFATKTVVALLSKIADSNTIAFMLSASDDITQVNSKFDLRNFLKENLTKYQSKGGGSALSVQGTLNTTSHTVEQIFDEMKQKLTELDL